MKFLNNKLIPRTLVVIIISMTLLASAAVIISAQQANPAKPAPKYTEVKYSADASSYRWVGDDRILVLSGNVKFVQGDTILVADKVDYRESTRTANASGNLKIYDDLNTITGDLCTVNFKDKKGTITGNAHLVAKPKPGQAEKSDSNALKSQLKDQANLTCGSIEYYYKDKKAVASTAVKVVQKDRTVTSDQAVYYVNDEVVDLIGNVKGTDGKDKHSFAAPRVRVSLKETDQWIEAEKASGTFYIKEDEEAEPSAMEKAVDAASPPKPAGNPAPEQ